MKSFAIELSDDVVERIKEICDIKSDADFRNYLQQAVVEGIIKYLLEEVIDKGVKDKVSKDR